MKQFVIKEDLGFRLIVKKNPCARPRGLYNIEFVQETLKEGQVDTASTYQFFLTDDELKTLSEQLVK